MARNVKFLLLALLLASCGGVQPLVLRSTPQVTPFATPMPQTSAVVISPTTSSEPTNQLTTPTPSVVPQTTDMPTAIVAIYPQLPPTPTNRERWQAQQLNQRPFTTQLEYYAQKATPLYWFDPQTGQTVLIGSLIGNFTATAEFDLRINNQKALVVPYIINESYGLTAISEAIIARMHDAGYTGTVEAFVLVSDAIQPI